MAAAPPGTNYGGSAARHKLWRQRRPAQTMAGMLASHGDYEGFQRIGIPEINQALPGWLLVSRIAGNAIRRIATL